MNIAFYMCIALVPVFWLLALFFALGKEKAANCISGFLFFSKEEKAKYDRKRMAADYRNDCLLWGGIMLAGAFGFLWISGYAAAAAYLVWLILALKDVHLDTEKAFEKYKLK